MNRKKQRCTHSNKINSLAPRVLLIHVNILYECHLSKYCYYYIMSYEFLKCMNDCDTHTFICGTDTVRREDVVHTCDVHHVCTVTVMWH